MEESQIKSEEAKTEVAATSPQAEVVSQKSNEQILEEKKLQAIKDFLPDRLKGKEGEGNAESKEKEGQKNEGILNKPAAEGQKAEETTPSPAPKGPSVADKFLELARKERSLLQRKKEYSDLRKKVDHYETLFAKAKEDPQVLMQAAGISLDDQSAALLRSPEEAEEKKQVRRIGDEVKELRQQLEEAKEFENQARMREAESTFRANLSQFANENKEKYPTIAADPEGQELAFQIFASYHAQQGDLPRKLDRSIDFETVFEKAEEALRAQVSDRLKRYRDIPVYKDYFSALKEAQAEAKPANQIPSKAPETKTKTLTNTPSVSTPRPSLGPGRQADLERMRYAASLIKDA